MAEPFGIVAGAVGISAAFTACVDCFGYIQLGRHFGRDFETDQLSLDCARLRLTRWGQAVGIYDDPKLGKPEATAAEIQTAKNTMLQILVLFADSGVISKEYQLNAKAGQDLTLFSATDMSPDALALDNKMKQLAIKRQKGAHILKLASWALYHRSEPQGLIESITSLIDNLEKLFSASQTQLTLVRQEIAEIKDRESLRLVAKAAEIPDSMLKAATQEVLTGHRYLDVRIRGTAQTGDEYDSKWEGNVLGASHTYDGVEIEHGGKGLIGNKYGGKGFWD